MLKLVALSLAVLLAGCVTQEVDREGNPVKRGPTDELVLDHAGRLVVRPTRLIAPCTIIVNSDTPTEREIRMLGVEGLPESKAPKTFEKCQEYLAKFIAAEEQIFVKPALDSDLKASAIYGLVYLQAYEDDNGNPGPLIPNGYLCVNTAMLSVGLVKIRNAMEVSDEAERGRMIAAEKRAKEKRLGLWSDQP